MKCLALIATVALLPFASTIAQDRGLGATRLSGFQEVPAISTAAGGTFRAAFDGTTIAWELGYADTSSAVTQAHIHFAQRGVNGGIAVWLCGNTDTTPAGVQACPAAPATISGLVTAGDVVGPATQGIAAGEFAELVRALRAGKAYVNVHTTNFPGGEIRAQLNDHRGGDDRD
jgi:hypothetical protein